MSLRRAYEQAKLSGRSEQGDFMVGPGMFEPVLVVGIREHVPNRYGEEFDEEDLLGWIRFEGELIHVQSAYWGGCLVWEPIED